MIGEVGPVAKPVRPFHILTKPIGAICNLDCRYCFYLEKEKLYPENREHRDFRMKDQVLENYIRQYIAQQDAPEVHFAWQGGEPTLMGLDYFRRVVEFQQRHAGGKKVHNAIQTNGVLLTDEWCAFLRAHAFLVGLSIDGPAELHDGYRVDKAGRGTHAAMMAAWERLKQHGVEYNTLTVVHRHNAKKPLEVYEFLKSHGSAFMQFIPLVERLPEGAPGDLHDLSGPPDLRARSRGPVRQVTDWSVDAGDYGEFLCRIFDQWVRRDVGTVFVQMFDWHLSIEMGLGSPICVFSKTCGRALAMEHNGDVYSCDHYVYPEFKLGNIAQDPLAAMVESPAQRRFGNDKHDRLPAYCKRCEVLDHCQGECPKHRFTVTPDGEAGLNYLCPSYKKFFNHARPQLQLMASLLRTGRWPGEIMRMI
ncbi:MAG TPA: anaerobic sulfatase maturase [Phycisphaerae bacterium]|nr:anaerobic sulfatase maturase [Phycisphaerae bacterium]